MEFSFFFYHDDSVVDQEKRHNQYGNQHRVDKDNSRQPRVLAGNSQQKGNSGNQCGKQQITVSVPAPVLRKGDQEQNPEKRAEKSGCGDKLHKVFSHGFHLCLALFRKSAPLICGL